MKMSFVENCDLYLLSGTHFINLCKKVEVCVILVPLKQSEFLKKSRLFPLFHVMISLYVDICEMDIFVNIAKFQFILKSIKKKSI